MRTSVVFLVLTLGTACLAQSGVELRSPGLPSGRVEADGTIAEDWGAFRLRLAGEGLAARNVTVSPVQVAGVVPGALIETDYGGARLLVTAFRAPAFPSGVDVVRAKVQNPGAGPLSVRLLLDMPEGAIVREHSALVGGRVVLSYPDPVQTAQPVRAWGHCDEATSMPGWGSPAVPCDPAFRNIRAGLGGVPIRYLLPVEPNAEVMVALGLMESHWISAGQRVQTCVVEGAKAVTVDPIARWGRHQPGVLLFRGRDIDGNGKLDITVMPAARSQDQNPILNAIWLFPAEVDPKPELIVSGSLNGAALKFVDVGGPSDQSVYGAAKLEWSRTIAPNGEAEFTFLVACNGATLGPVGTSTWTPESLTKAAQDVWRDWKP